MDQHPLPETRGMRIAVATYRSRRIVCFDQLGRTVAAWWTLQLFNALKNDKTATVKGLMNSLASVGQSVGLVYALAAIVGMVSIVVMLMRLDEDEAVLPGIAYVMALPSLISPLFSAYATHMIIEAFHTTVKMDFAKLGGDVAQLLVISIIAGIFALVVILLFTFLPFSARVGKRLSPIIAIGLITIGIAALAFISFWLVGLAQEPTNPAFGS